MTTGGQATEHGEAKASVGGDSNEGRGAVRLESVSKIYPGGHTPAVADFSVLITPGEFFSILGPSGSGKTTTLRLIAGFERPSSGRVFLGGLDVTRLPPYRRPVHTVFQNYALFPHMNVQQNVSYPLKMRRIGHDEIERRVGVVLDRVAMTAFAKRMPNQLSGGQRQRVALARALVGEPEVVLLDEPLGALDLKLRQDMQLVLQHLQREVGITFVYVTHDQGEALAMSDRIAILSDGHVHQVAMPSEVYSRPATSFVAAFVGKTNLLDCVRIDTTRVRAGELEFDVQSAPASSRFAVSLRPEALRLGVDVAGCTNRVEALVEESIYQGSDVELRLGVAGHQLVARAPVGRFHVGERVTVGWAPGDAIIVATDPTTLDLAAR